MRNEDKIVPGKLVLINSGSSYRGRVGLIIERDGYTRNTTFRLYKVLVDDKMAIFFANELTVLTAYHDEQ
jgi:hypothetical protein